MAGPKTGTLIAFFTGCVNFSIFWYSNVMVSKISFSFVEKTRNRILQEKLHNNISRLQCTLVEYVEELQGSKQARKDSEKKVPISPHVKGNSMLWLSLDI